MFCITASNPGWFSPFSNAFNGSLTKPFNHAFPGAKVNETDFGGQVDDTVTQNDKMDFTLILLGTNGGTDFQNTYTAQLLHLWSHWPNRPIYALGVLNRNPDNNRDLTNTYIMNAVTAAQASGVDVTYWNTNGWIDPTTDTNDGLHPNTTGNAKIVAQILARLP